MGTRKALSCAQVIVAVAILSILTAGLEPAVSQEARLGLHEPAMELIPGIKATETTARNQPEFILTVKSFVHAEDRTDTTTCVAAVEMLYASLSDQTPLQVILWWMTPEGRRAQFVLDEVEGNVWAAKINPGLEQGVHCVELIVLLEAEANQLRTVCTQHYELNMPEMLLTRSGVEDIAPTVPRSAPAHDRTPIAPTENDSTTDAGSHSRVPMTAGNAIARLQANPWPLLIVALLLLNVGIGFSLGLMHVLSRRLGWRIPFLGQGARDAEAGPGAASGDRVRNLMEQAGILAKASSKTGGPEEPAEKGELGEAGTDASHEKTLIIPQNGDPNEISTEEIVKSLGMTLDQIENEQAEANQGSSDAAADPSGGLGPMTVGDETNSPADAASSAAQPGVEPRESVNAQRGSTEQALEEEDLVKKLDLNDLSF